ncbi:MAG: hypothetical protein JNK12_23295 [Acidimicrobiales bacterium]|nr:hypothetical protein [Acidimicrobiales bacterium]
MRRILLVAAAVVALVAGIMAPASAQEADRSPTLTVTPSTGLVDGQTVTVEGHDWWPDSSPLLEFCEVGTSRCATQWVRVDADDVGHFAVERVARAYFPTEEGEVDCLVSACEFRVDFIALVGAPIAFDPVAPLLPRPSLTVTPGGGLADGDQIVVEGAHFTPGDWVFYSECAVATTEFRDDDCHGLGNGSDVNQAWNASPGAGPPEWWYAMRQVGPDGAFRDRLWAYANAYTYPRRTDCRVVACELVASVRNAIVARVPLSFDSAAPLRGPPTIEVRAGTGLVHHQWVTVRGEGFYGREPMSLQQCVVAVSSCFMWNFEHPEVDATGAFVARIRVNRTVRLSSGRRADCRVAHCTVRISRFRFAGRPQQIEAPIRFTS